MIHSAPSAESNQMPSDANFPSALSFSLSHITSLIRKLRSVIPFSLLSLSLR